MIIDGASDYESDDPEARPRTLAQARDPARRPRRRLRGAQLHRPRRARARHLRRGDRRLPDRHGEDVLGRRLRQPDLHLRPRPVHRLRRLRRRRRGALPGRRARRPASRPTCPSIPTPRGSTPRCGAATCAAACSPTRARWATRCASPTTTSTATPPASRPTRSRPRGHPGFPADSVQVDHNYIYSNNLDLFGAATRRSSRWSGSCPSGVGIFWAGHNNGRVHDNWIWDNWRTGAWLLSIPDFLVTPEGNINPGGSCRRPARTRRSRPRAATATTTTSSAACRRGFKPFDGAAQVRQQRRRRPAASRRNGVDFWWDEGGLGTVTGNCWFNNVGPTARAPSVTGPGRGRRQRRPADRLHQSASSGDGVKLAYLLVLLPRARGRPAARAVRLVHAAAAARLAGGRGASSRRSRGRPRVPEDRARQAAPGPDRRASPASPTRASGVGR